MMGPHRMDIGAVLLGPGETTYALPLDPEPKGAVRLPGMAALLNPTAFNFNDPPVRSIAPLGISLGPPTTLEAQQQQRRHSVQPESPHNHTSAASSPALSSVSTAVTEPQPTTPPNLTQSKGFTSPGFVQQQPLPPADTPLNYPAYQSGYNCAKQQPRNSPVRKHSYSHSDGAAIQHRQTASTRGASYARARREHRPTYGVEEEHFIWYHRIDLGMDWQDIRRAYSAQFPNRVVRGHQGIQCKYYRCTEMNGIPKCRERNRTSHSAQTYGLRAKFPDLWYSWMKTPLSLNRAATVAGNTKQVQAHPTRL